MNTRRSAQHGSVATLFGLIVLVGPGLLALFFAVFLDVLPERLQTVNVDWVGEGGARALELIKGVWLLVMSWGLFFFSRWSWFGYLAWAGWSVYGLSQTLFAGEAVVTVEGISILVPLALPYLWIKRREFGIGSAPSVGT